MLGVKLDRMKEGEEVMQEDDAQAPWETPEAVEAEKTALEELEKKKLEEELDAENLLETTEDGDGWSTYNATKHFDTSGWPMKLVKWVDRFGKQRNETCPNMTNPGTKSDPEMLADALRNGKTIFSKKCLQHNRFWRINPEYKKRVNATEDLRKLQRQASLWTEDGCLLWDYADRPAGELDWQLCLGCYNLMYGALALGPMCWVGPCTGKNVPNTAWAGFKDNTMGFWRELLACMFQPVMATWNAITTQ